MDPEVTSRFDKLESRLDLLENHLHELMGQASITSQLLKWVVLPLLVIVGGLVGIKVALP